MSITLVILVSFLLVCAAVMVVTSRNLLAAVVLLSVYSGLQAILFALLGATDVAFTEAVVGAGVSTAVVMALPRWVRPAMASTLHPSRWRVASAAVVTLVIGAGMLHGVHLLPAFGDPGSPAHQHVGLHYVANSMKDMHTPNYVTAVLADYRGFDTLIETSVVLTGAVACLLILGCSRASGQEVDHEL